MGIRFKLCVIIVPMLLVTVGLALLAGPMFPFRRGNSTDFWLAATGIKLVPDATFSGGDLYPVHGGRIMLSDGWVVYCLYYSGGIELDGPTLYRVRFSEVLPDFGRVLERLDSEPPGSVPGYVTKGRQDWLASKNRDASPVAFLNCVRRARLREYEEEIPRFSHFVREFGNEVEERWRRSGFYILNLTFEFLFLNSLILLAFLPWLLNLRPWLWGLHVAPIPFLLCVPYYLGYAPVLPSGGVLYPFAIGVLDSIPDNWTPLESSVVYSLPRFLDALNQTCWGPPSRFFGGGPSPHVLVAVGVALGVVVFALRWVSVGILKPAKDP